MPEGDVVHRTARKLGVLAGQQLTTSDFRVPQHATADLRGATVVGTSAVGKHLLTRFDLDGRRITLHTHLKMEGSWRVYPAGRRWDRPGRSARVVLRTPTHEAVGFTLGVVELLSTEHESRVVGHLGPDLLDPGCDLDEAVRRLTRQGDRELGQALLDQSLVSGLGTIYVSEACFRAGVSPRLAVRQLPDMGHLLSGARSLLLTGLDTARPHYAVYRRHRQPCRRCGTVLVAGNFGSPPRERTLYWCPSCQPQF